MRSPLPQVFLRVGEGLGVREKDGHARGHVIWNEDYELAVHLFASADLIASVITCMAFTFLFSP